MVERDFKHQRWPPKDHFKKLLKATYPHHSYSVKHKLKDCTMIKNFMTSGAFSKVGSLEGTRVGKVRRPLLGKRRS
jgi:hypothetical protein